MRSSIVRVEDWSARRLLLIAALIYLVISFFIYWPLWPADPHLVVGCACGDTALQSWFLGYTPWALFHGHNPFFTTYMDYPRGANLASNTLMPLLGIVGYPITALFGALATFNLFMWLSYPLSALSAAFVAKRWTNSNIGSLYAGLIYGFSPYIVHQGYSHLNLTFVPLPPLILYFVWRVLVDQDVNSRRAGLGLGLLVSAQFLISTEVALTTAIIAGILALLWCGANWRRLTRSWTTYMRDALTPAIVITAVAVAFPVLYALFGPEAVRAPYQNGILNPYRADLLGTIIPNGLQQFGPAHLKSIGNSLTAGAVYENGSYLGVPLVAALLFFWARYLRNGWIRFSGIATLVCWILSLGPWLVVDSHQTTVRLPFYYLAKLPLVADLLPVRFSLYVSFFAAITIALGIGTWANEARRQHEVQTPVTRWHDVVTLSAVGCLLIGLLAIFPKLPLPTGSTDKTNPTFFTSIAAQAIPVASVVLTYPYPDPTFNQDAMLWQITTNWRWKMMGAYAQIPGQFPNSVTPNPWPTPPLGVANFLEYWDGVASGTRLSMPAQVITTSLVDETKIFVHRYQIDSVVVDLAASNSSMAVRLFNAALGKPLVTGGVALWAHLIKRVSVGHVNS